MRYCTKCGTQMTDEDRFCPNCGTKVPPETTGDDFVSHVRDLNDTDDTTNQFSPQDIQQNKGFAVLSYIGLLVLIPIFGASHSRFARYHANQGLVLLIFSAAYSIARAIVMGILRAILCHDLFWPGSVVYSIINGATGLVHILFLILMIIGIVNAAKGRAKELPVIGRIHLLK
ncbi:MAG: zinc-ribbon domain-containing protein [Oscillospiraceae bacterium]|nr:zinc-ribbon domain-containing protein [Oscillospiraceae bacterium]